MASKSMSAVHPAQPDAQLPGRLQRAFHPDEPEAAGRQGPHRRRARLPHQHQRRGPRTRDPGAPEGPGDVILAILSRLEALHGVSPDAAQIVAEESLRSVAEREAELVKQTVTTEEKAAGID